MTSFADRLRLLLDRTGMTQADLSRKCGLSRATLSRYLQGRFEAKQDSIYKIANAANVSEAWLMGADVPMERQPEPPHASIPPGFEPPPKTHKVPLVGRIACGDPITAEENIEGFVDVPDGLNPDFALRCVGNSMVDAGIASGDVVYIRAQPEVENGQIAAVRIGDEATLKRIYWDGVTLTLMPANQAFPPLTFSGPELERVRIEGRAIGYLHLYR